MYFDRLLSRVDGIIESVEKGEPVDWKQQRLLADLDFVRLGAEFADEMVRRDREHDDLLEQFAAG